MFNWMHSFLKQKTKPFTGGRRSARRTTSRRLFLEQLEDRLVLDSGGAAGLLFSGTVHLNPTNDSTEGAPQVIPNIHIEPIFVQDPAHGNVVSPYQSQLLTFMQTYASSGFIPRLLSQYSLPGFTIGNGTVGTSDIVSVAPTTTSTAGGPAYDDGTVNSRTGLTPLEVILQNQINLGHTAASDGLNNCYVVVLPPGDAVDAGNNMDSTNALISYHYSFLDSNGTNYDTYIVLPDQSPTGPNENLVLSGLTALQGETTALSHELSESITDPNAGVHGNPIGWCNPTTLANGEVADEAANETYTLNGQNYQYLWSNALTGITHDSFTGSNDLVINQVSAPAVTAVQPVQVATFTAPSGGTFYAQVYDTVTNPNGLPSLDWSNITITGGANGRYVITATPPAGAVTVGSHGTPFNQDGLYVIVSSSPLNYATGSGAPISVRYAPYTIATSAPLTYFADSGSGVNNFVLAEHTGNFDLTDNGLLVFSQPIDQTTSIHIGADPTVPGDSGDNVNDALTIDYSGGVFTNPIIFDGGPGSGTHTLTVTGGAFTTATFSYITATSGDIALGSQTITYSETSALVATVGTTNAFMNYGAAQTTIIVTNPGVSGETLVSSTSGATTLLDNPSTSLQMLGTGGHDAIDVNSLGAGYAATLEIAATGGSDLINFNTALNLGSGANLSNLWLTAAAIDLNTDTITTTGYQYYDGGVTLGANATLTSSDDAITFGGTLNGGENLAVAAAAGTITFSGAVGLVPLTGLIITSAYNVNAAAITAGTISQWAGSGTSTFSGLLDATAAGGLILSGTNFNISGGIFVNAGAAAVTIEGTGNVTLNSGITKGASGIGNVNLSAGGTLALNAGIDADNAQLTLTANGVLTTSGTQTLIANNIGTYVGMVGSTLTVYASPHPNTANFEFSAGQDTVSLNGVTLSIKASAPGAVNYVNNGDDGVVNVMGAGGDSATLTPTQATLTGANNAYTWSGANCAVVNFFSSGVSSNATFSVGSGDTYVGNYDYSEAASHTNSYYNFAVGFHTVVGNAVAGSGSLAFMAVTPTGANTLNATPTTATIAGTSYSNTANNFSVVAVYAPDNSTTANNDQATLSTTANAGDIIGGVPGYSFTQGTVSPGRSYAVYAVAFSKVNVTGSANTVAYIGTSNASSDTYAGTPTSSEVKGSGAIPTYDITVLNCGRVQAYAGSAGQTATMTRNTTDTVATPEADVTENKGSGYDNFAIGFANIVVIIG